MTLLVHCDLAIGNPIITTVKKHDMGTGRGCLGPLSRANVRRTPVDMSKDFLLVLPPKDADRPPNTFQSPRK